MTTVAVSLGGFLTFIRAAGISTVVLPDSSPSIQTAYDLSIATVNLMIAQASPVMYVTAVYNLGLDIIFSIAQDESGQTYFSAARTKWNVYGFVSGVVQSTSDNGTGDSLVVQEAAKNFTLSDLQNLKTPYGRAYLAIAQKTGSLWGMS